MVEFEIELIRERVKAGVDRAAREGKKIGRPSVTEETRARCDNPWVSRLVLCFLDDNHHTWVDMDAVDASVTIPFVSTLVGSYEPSYTTSIQEFFDKSHHAMRMGSYTWANEYSDV